MKVKDLVEQLKKLDQEKNIWVLYDLCFAQEPRFTKCEEDVHEIKKGDYVHEAW